MRATFQCDGTRTRLVGEWALKPFTPELYEAHFQAAGSGTEMFGVLYRGERDEFMIDGSMTRFVGRLEPTA